MVDQVDRQRVAPQAPEQEEAGPSPALTTFLTTLNLTREPQTPPPETPASPSAVYVDLAAQRVRQIEPDVRKAVVMCGEELSDYIFAVPALDALRVAYPQAEIVLLGTPEQAQFLSGRPGPVDRVEVVPGSTAVNALQEHPHAAGEQADHFFGRMTAEGFDLAIQLQSDGLRANPFVRRLGARLTVGFSADEAIPLDRMVPYAHYQLKILSDLEVVGLAGAEPVSLEPHVHVTRQDLAEVEQFVPDTLMPLVVLYPGGPDPRRRWPVEKFIALGAALAWSGGQVVVVGSHADHELAAKVAQNLPPETLNLAGKLSPGGLAGLLSRAQVVIANNGFPLHLAVAVGAKTVGLFWCADFIARGPITRSAHRPAISWRLRCPECGLNISRSSCDHQISYLDGIDFEDVLVSALDLTRPGGRRKRVPHHRMGSLG